jgi:spermidine synthase
VRGLFEDPRARILVEDGRTYLRATRDRYDVIVADLFVPWQAGEGTLYSREHYATIRDRLRPGGIFTQWVPLYQVSRREFDIVARTLLAVFPEVTLWRGDFSSANSLMALVCRTEPGSLDPEAVLDRIWEVEDPCLLLRDASQGPPRTLSPFLLAYCGNLGEAPLLVGTGPICTDDRPLIEYLAPITQRRVGAGKASWFLGDELVAFLEELQARVPLDHDLYLADLTPHDRTYPRAGLLVQKGRSLKQAGKTAEAAAVETELRALLDSLEAE